MSVALRSSAVGEDDSIGRICVHSGEARRHDRDRAVDQP
jgi:hypothetical protein